MAYRSLVQDGQMRLQFQHDSTARNLLGRKQSSATFRVVSNLDRCIAFYGSILEGGRQHSGPGMILAILAVLRRLAAFRAGLLELSKALCRGHATVVRYRSFRLESLARCGQVDKSRLHLDLQNCVRQRKALLQLLQLLIALHKLPAREACVLILCLAIEACLYSTSGP